MTDGEYGRLQKWADERGVDVTVQGKGSRRKWTVADCDGVCLAVHRSRSLALRKAKENYTPKRS